MGRRTREGCASLCAHLRPTPPPFAAMENATGEQVDLYIPRKCSWTNKLITAKDHAGGQLNIAHLDDDGVYTGAYTTFALSGKTRSMGESDSALDHLWAKKKAEVGQTY